jgi:hypothetical protein
LFTVNTIVMIKKKYLYWFFMQEDGCNDENLRVCAWYP